MSVADEVQQPSAEHGRGVPVRRILGFLGPSTFAISLIWGSVPGILLALQVQDRFGEENKIATLALITSLGAFASMIVQPIGGILSDRTRSRFGRRAPWIVIGTLGAGLALIGLGSVDQLWSMIVMWITIQLGLGLAWTPLTATLPDRIPAERRGVASSIWGLGAMLGSLGGQVFGAAFADAIPAGYLTLGGLAAVAVVLFVAFCPEPSSRQLSIPRFDLRTFLFSFWVSPRRHPDFFWAFTSRFLAYTGYWTVMGYKLYILQDYVGLKERAIGFVAIVGLTMGVGIAISTAVSGKLSDKIGRRRIFVAGSAAGVAIAFLLPAIWPTAPVMIIMAAVGGLGFGCFQAVDTALISQVLPDSDGYAKDLGIVNIASTLPQIIAPAVSGAIVLTLGYGPLFVVGAALGVLSAIAIYQVKSVR